LNGKIADFRFYNRNLSAVESGYLYNYGISNARNTALVTTTNVNYSNAVTNYTSFISSAYSTNISTKSVTINFYGSFTSVTLTRNGTILTKNATSPFIDTNNLLPNVTYNYTLIPYNVNGFAGNTISINATLLILGTGYNIVNPNNLELYYPFEIFGELVSVGNYASGKAIYDASMSVPSLISGNNYIVGNTALTTNGSNSQYVTLRNITTGSIGLTFSFWVKIAQDISGFNIIDPTGLILYYTFDASSVIANQVGTRLANYAYDDIPIYDASINGNMIDTVNAKIRLRLA
jgi:hypothetical protein